MMLPAKLGARNRLNRIMFIMIGERIIIANGTQKFASKNRPTRISAIPTKGMKYPVLTIAVKKSIAGWGKTAELDPG